VGAGVISLDVATDRLLHRVSYRQAFLEARYDELELAPADLAALQEIDREQLVETADAVRNSLLERRHRGSGGIRSTYPQTLAAWQAIHDDEDLALFLDQFMESEAFERYHEIPHIGHGLSLEEAVYRFFLAEDVGDPQSRECEFLAGICKALALNPAPAFTVNAPLRRAPAGWFAVSSEGPPRLFASVSGRYVNGALTPLLAELLTARLSPQQLAEAHGVSPEVVAAARDRFTSLGLLAEVPVD